jgi:hypothetical protein
VHKVVAVQRAAQAFAVKHRVVFHGNGHAAVGIHVREIELAAALDRRGKKFLLGTHRISMVVWLGGLAFDRAKAAHAVAL